MDLLKKLKYAGLCLGVAAVAFSSTDAFAQAGPWEDDDTITMTIVEPSAIPAVTQAPVLGDWAAINVVGTTASFVIDPEGVLDDTNIGVYPDSRLIELDSAPIVALEFNVTGGLVGETMSVAIGAPTNPADLLEAGVGNVFVDLVHDTNPGDNGYFRVNTWVCERDTDNTTTVGTPEVVTIDSGTGLGTLVLGDGDDVGTTQITEGEAYVRCGMTVATDASGDDYESGDYEGTVRFVVDYF